MIRPFAPCSPPDASELAINYSQLESPHINLKLTEICAWHQIGKNAKLTNNTGHAAIAQFMTDQFSEEGNALMESLRNPHEPHLWEIVSRHTLGTLAVSLFLRRIVQLDTPIKSVQPEPGIPMSHVILPDFSKDSAGFPYAYRLYLPQWLTPQLFPDITERGRSRQWHEGENILINCVREPLPISAAFIKKIRPLDLSRHHTVLPYIKSAFTSGPTDISAA